MLYRKIKLSTFGLYLKAVSKLWLVPLLTVNVLVPVISAVLYKNGGAGAESDIVTVMYFLLPISTVWTSIFVSEFFFSDRTRDVLFFYSRKKRFAVSQLFFLLPLANVAAVTLLHFRCLSYSVPPWRFWRCCCMSCSTSLPCRTPLCFTRCTAR